MSAAPAGALSPAGSRRGAAIAVFLAAGLLFAAGLGGRDLWHLDEHRYAEVARVMTTPTGDWLVPHLNGPIYKDKPPLFFWMVAFLYGSLGLDLSIAARLPSVVAGAGAVGLTFALGRRLYGPRAGLAAAIVLATVAEFQWLARRANLDALMTLFTTLGCFCFAVAAVERKGSRATRLAVGAAGAVALGVGCLVKGPAALVLPAVAFLAFAAVVREGRLALALLALLPLSAVPLAAWLAAASARAGPEFARSMGIGVWLAHPAGLVDKQEPWWYYAVGFPLTALPWTLFLPAAIVSLVRWRPPAWRRADLFVVCWLAGMLVALSVSSAKRNLYVLPALPALALLLGRLTEDLLARPPERSLARWVAVGRLPLAAVALVGGVGCAVLAASVLVGADGALLGSWDGWPLLRPAATTLRAVVGLALGAVAAVGGWWALRPRVPGSAAAGLALASLGASLLIGVVVLPVANRGEAARPFMEAIAPRVGDAPLADYGGADYAANWVLRRNEIEMLGTVEEANHFFQNGHGPAWAITTAATLRRRGMPEGAEVAMRWPRPLDHELLLLGRAAPQPPGASDAR